VSYLQHHREREKNDRPEQTINPMSHDIKGALPLKEARLPSPAGYSGMQIAVFRVKCILSCICDHKNVLDNKSNL